MFDKQSHHALDLPSEYAYNEAHPVCIKYLDQNITEAISEEIVLWNDKENTEEKCYS